jgi:hypothetical protein
MAVNAYNLQTAQRVRFVRATPQGGRLPLQFDLLTIDSNDQYYDLSGHFGPVSLTNFKRQDGTVVATQVLDANLALPRAVRGQDQDRTGVFFYGGI